MRGESIRYIASEVGIHPMTAWMLSKRVRAQTTVPIYCRCGKASGHRGWCAHRVARSPASIACLVSQWRDITTVNIYIPSRPQYERPGIENERETEIPLLLNSRRIQSLDAPMFDGDESGHTFFNSGALTPLEVLMLKEEMQSAEFQWRQKGIQEWSKFQDRKDSAFQTV